MTELPLSAVRLTVRPAMWFPKWSFRVTVIVDAVFPSDGTLLGAEVMVDAFASGGPGVKVTDAVVLREKPSVVSAAVNVTFSAEVLSASKSAIPPAVVIPGVPAPPTATGRNCTEPLGLASSFTDLPARGLPNWSVIVTLIGACVDPSAGTVWETGVILETVADGADASKDTVAVWSIWRSPSVVSVAVKVADSATESCTLKVTWPLGPVTSEPCGAMVTVLDGDESVTVLPETGAEAAVNRDTVTWLPTPLITPGDSPTTVEALAETVSVPNVTCAVAVSGMLPVVSRAL